MPRGHDPGTSIARNGAGVQAERSTQGRKPVEALYPQSKNARKAADGVHGAISSLAESATPGVEKIADIAKASLSGGAQRIVSAQADLVDGVRTYVRDRPFTAVTLAALIGALAVSRLFGNRSTGG